MPIGVDLPSVTQLHDRLSHRLGQEPHRAQEQALAHTRLNAGSPAVLVSWAQRALQRPLQGLSDLGGDAPGSPEGKHPRDEHMSLGVG
eukprot:12376682-Alexandrium_andersonii.AAC.1